MTLKSSLINKPCSRSREKGKQTTQKDKTMKAKFDFKSIKTFEDACAKQGIDPLQLPDMSMIDPGMGKALIAAYKLFVIFKAINDGWAPNWNNAREYKYFPWFYVAADAARPGGFGFSGSFFDLWITSTICGSRLCTDTSEKAMYIANTFKDLYIDFMLIR